MPWLDAPAPLHECISHGAGDGAMGFHFIKGSLLDTTLEPTRPEALVYAPDKHGNLHLAALEYVVFQDPWDKEHPGVMPELFGQMFMLVPPDPTHSDGTTVFNIPPFYMLHAWIWVSNPSGLFNPWNPSVSATAHRRHPPARRSRPPRRPGPSPRQRASSSPVR